MSEMVERVKAEVFRAIAGQPGALITNDAAERAARAAIAAMREPTEAMLEDGRGEDTSMHAPVAVIYTAMIDAALGKE